MKLNWKQIALGVLINIVSVIFFISVLVAVLFAREAFAGRSIENFNEKISYTTPMLALTLTLGLVALFLGAYVAAARSDSQKSSVVHAVIMAAISIAVAGLIDLIEHDIHPLWYNVLAYGLILPTAYFGGLWRWRNLQRTHRVLDVATSPLPEVPQR